MKKLLAASAVALVASAALSSPSWAQVTGDHAITVFTERDMVVAEGYSQGDVLTISIKRGGTLIGQTEPGEVQPVTDSDTGEVLFYALEVNHGPLGLAQPGDCWVNATPDILPGDVVEIATAGQTAVETTEARNVTITSGPTEEANGDVVLKGQAVAPGGGQFGADELAEEVRDLASGFRGDPDGGVVYDALGSTAWTATYSAPFSNNVVGTKDVSPNPPETLEARRKQAILDGGHAIVWANLAANETTIFEQGEPGGSAPGCEVPNARNTLVAVTPKLISSANANASVTASGVIVDGVDVSVKVNDGTPIAVTLNRDLDTWEATIPATEFTADGTYNVTATFSGPGAPANPQTLEVVKDVTAPTFDASLVRASGTHPAPFDVSLNTDDPQASIFYTRDGSDPATSNSRVRYQGGQIRIGMGSTTFKAVAFDSVNNKSAQLSRTYTVKAPPPPPPPALQNTSVKLNVSSKAIKLKSRKAISGRVTPANSGNFVTLKIVRRGPDLVKRLPVSNGNFKFSYKAKVTGLHKVQVSFAQDSDSKASKSVVKRFRVTRR